MDNVSDEFRDLIKNECGITWSDKNTEKRIDSAILNGIAEFKDMFGKSINVEEFGLVRRLFLAYCKYYYYDQMESFQINYRSDIITARMKYEADCYEEETKSNV